MSNSKKSNCVCGVKTDFAYCKNCSKIKMVIGLKNGYKHLLNVWYNYYSENNNPNEKIINGMQNRLLNHPAYNGAVNVLSFYNRNDNFSTLIKKITKL